MNGLAQGHNNAPHMRIKPVTFSQLSCRCRTVIDAKLRCSNKLVLWVDQTNHFRVICPCVLKNPVFDIVRLIETLSLFGSPCMMELEDYSRTAIISIIIKQ